MTSNLNSPRNDKKSLTYRAIRTSKTSRQFTTINHVRPKLYELNLNNSNNEFELNSDNKVNIKDLSVMNLNDNSMN